MKNKEIGYIANQTIKDYNRIMDNLSSAFKPLQQIKKVYYGGMYSALLEAQKSITINNDVLNLIQDMKQHYEKIFEPITRLKMNNISMLSTLSINSLFLEKTLKAYSFTKIENGYKYVFDDCLDNEEIITNDDISEMCDDINDIIENDLDNKTIEKSKDKWKEKHPFVFEIILIVIGQILQILIGYIQPTAITNNTTNIYIDSSSKSTVICNIPENTKVTVLETDIPYMCKIIYTDTENLKDIEGYAAKRNIKIIKHE